MTAYDMRMSDWSSDVCSSDRKHTLRGVTQMQFEPSTRQRDAAMIATALRPPGPEARVAFDAERGHLEVLSSASAAQVLGVLDAMGCVATPLSQDVHISGGSTCCGQCA